MTGVQTCALPICEDRSFAEFLGGVPEDVCLLFEATVTRSSGDIDEVAAGYGIGYFHQVWNRAEGLSRNILGGSAVFAQRLAAGLGDRLRLNASVLSVEQARDEVIVRWAEDGRERELRARHAIVATQAHVTRRIVRGLPEETAAALDFVRYGPYVVGAFLTNETEPMPWDPLYAMAKIGRAHV